MHGQAPNLYGFQSCHKAGYTTLVMPLKIYNNIEFREQFENV